MCNVNNVRRQNYETKPQVFGESKSVNKFGPKIDPCGTPGVLQPNKSHQRRKIQLLHSI